MADPGKSRIKPFSTQEFLSGNAGPYLANDIAEWLRLGFGANPILESYYQNNPLDLFGTSVSLHELFRDAFRNPEAARRAALELHYGLLEGRPGYNRIYLEPGKAFPSGYHLSAATAPYFGTLPGLTGQNRRFPLRMTDVRFSFPFLRHEFANELHPLVKKYPVMMYVPKGEKYFPEEQQPAPEFLKSLSDKFLGRDDKFYRSLYMFMPMFYPRDILDPELALRYGRAYYNVLRDPEIYRNIGRDYARSGLGFLSYYEPGNVRSASYHAVHRPLGELKPGANIQNKFGYFNPNVLWHEYGHGRTSPLEPRLLAEGYATFYAYYRLAKALQEQDPELPNNLVLQLTDRVALPVQDIIRIGDSMGLDQPFDPRTPAPELKSIMNNPKLQALMALFAISPKDRYLGFEAQERYEKYRNILNQLKYLPKSVFSNPQLSDEERRIYEDIAARLSRSLLYGLHKVKGELPKETNKNRTRFYLRK